ncbi:MAG: class I SAM-dependent methyltransferase [Sedimentisphaerales bacterium]|nr:class I SAM-dependent methyltransferase [Sedimentisphaerales bacterium]
MHTKISTNNPFGYDRLGFAWELVPANSQAHLDFGCSQGDFMNALSEKNIKCIIGLDISRDEINQARQRFPHLDVRHINQTIPLPFEDETFDSIALLDVLEHVYEQEQLLQELYRVLRKDGLLIVTVPGKYFFSFLDRGNIQFYWPGLHRWYYCRTHSQEEYEYRYVNNPDHLIGCISARKRWHEHFSKDKLKQLLEKNSFNVVDFDGTAYFGRIIDTLEFLLRRPAALKTVLEPIKKWDNKTFKTANLFCLAQKS